MMWSEWKLKVYWMLVEVSEVVGVDVSEGGVEVFVEAWEES